MNSIVQRNLECFANQACSDKARGMRYLFIPSLKRTVLTNISWLLSVSAWLVLGEVRKFDKKNLTELFQVLIKVRPRHLPHAGRTSK